MAARSPPREWDAATYDSLPLPHERWGRRVLAALAVRGDERVLDVGVGFPTTDPSSNHWPACCGQAACVEAVLIDLGLPRIGEACYFATAEQTVERLATTGFTDIDVCVPDPARMESAVQFEAFLTSVALSAVLDSVPAGRRRQIVRDVVVRLPEPQVDFMRLQASARRAV